MDIIINDPGIAAAARETRASGIIAGVNGMDLGRYNLTDTSAANVQMFQDTLSKLHLAGMHAVDCTQFGKSCVLNSLPQLATEVRAVFDAQDNIGLAIGYTAGDSNTANILMRASDVEMKSASFDQNFSVLTGEAATGTVSADIATFNTQVTYKAGYAAILQSIGQTVFANPAFVLQLPTADSIRVAVNTLDVANTAATVASQATLSALGVPLSAVSTPAAVLAEVNLLVPAVKALNARFGALTTDYAGNTVATVTTNTLSHFKQILPYVKTMAAVKATCAQYLMGSVPSSAEQVALKNACTSFVAATASSNILKNVCAKVYYINTLVSPNVVQIVGGLSLGINADVPVVIASACSLLNGAPTPDGASTIAFSYTSAISTPAAWTTFIGTPSDFFDAVSSSAYAWVS